MIKIANLSFAYGKLSVFEGFNLHIPEGQSCLITGINGVGKSTLLRLMAGVLEQDRGEVAFHEKLGCQPKQRIGFISDRLSLYESLTVARSIELHRSVFKIDHFDDSLIHHTKIRMKQRVKELSIGQRTILHLSLVLSAKPEILLIDEVIHSIDAYLRKVFLEHLIKLLADRQLTVIMVNLNFHDIEHMVDRVILLKNGAIAVDEPIDQLKRRVKKAVSQSIPSGIPVICQSSQSDHFIYPFEAAHAGQINGDIIDLNLTEIVTAFIEGEYN